MATIFRFPKRPLVNLRILNDEEAKQQNLQNEMLGMQISQLGNIIGEQQNAQNFRADMAKIAELPDVSPEEKQKMSVMTLQQYFPEKAMELKQQRVQSLLQIANIDEIRKAGEENPKVINDYIEMGIGLDKLINGIDKIKNDPRRYNKTDADYENERFAYLGSLRNAIEKDPNASPELKATARRQSWDDRDYSMLFQYDNQRMKGQAGGSQFAKYARTTDSKSYISPTDISRINYAQVSAAQKLQEIDKAIRDNTLGPTSLREELIKYWSSEDQRDYAENDVENLIDALQPSLPKEYRGTSKRDLIKLYDKIDEIRQKYPRFANALEQYNALISGDMETWINSRAKSVLGERKNNVQPIPSHTQSIQETDPFAKYKRNQ